MGQRGCTGLASAKLESSLALWEAVEKASSIVTEFTRSACSELGLDPQVEVLLSFNHFCEEDLERIRGEEEHKRFQREICGYYYPERRLIVLSLPCIIGKPGSSGSDHEWEERLAETLAHELVHHCQFTQGHLCEIHLNPELALRVREALPYEARPHEVEAYEKQAELAPKLKSVKGFYKAIRCIERLYSPEAAIVLAGPLIFRVRDILDKHVKAFAESFVELAEKDVAENVQDIETVLKKLLTSALAFLGSTHVKTLLIHNDNDESLTYFFVTEKGFAFAITSDKETILAMLELILNNFRHNLPLLPLFLKPEGGPTLLELNPSQDPFVSSALGQLTLSYDHLLSGRIETSDFRYEVGAVRQCRAAQKICEEACGGWSGEASPAVSITEFVALLILIGWKPGTSVEVERFRETSCFIVALEGSKSLEQPELVICSGLKVEDIAAGISIAAKELAEKLNDEAFLKDMAAKLLRALQNTS